MKFFKTIISFCLVLCVFVLTSCGGINLGSMPNIDDTVYGNGGISVVKGDYVYFVNSTMSYKDLGKSDNDSGKVRKAGIYRTKLNEGKIELDDDDNVKNYEQVVSKVAGYEFTNLHIFDDYIYYATPNMDYKQDGTLNTMAIDFTRTKLDGTKTEIIYTAKNYTEEGCYEFYKLGSSIYLVVYEGDKIVSVEISNFIKGAITLVSGVSDVILPKITTYTYSNNVKAIGTQGYAYYTRDFNADDDNAHDTSSITGNILGRVNIIDATKTERKDHTIKYGLQDITTKYLFVTKNVDIYAIDSSFPISENAQGKQDIQLTHSLDTLSVSEFYANKNSDGFIYSKNSKTYYISNVIASQAKTYEIATSARKIVADDQNYAYYADGTKLYRLSLIPKYICNEDFVLEANSTIDGKSLTSGTKINKFTTISQSEYLDLTSAIDKNRFAQTLNAEMILEDEYLNTNYIDYGQENVIYYFSKYTGATDANQEYLKRVVMSNDNRELDHQNKVNEEDGQEIIDPETYEEYNLGFHTELLCVLDSEHKALISTGEKTES